MVDRKIFSGSSHHNSLTERREEVIPALFQTHWLFIHFALLEVSIQVPISGVCEKQTGPMILRQIPLSSALLLVCLLLSWQVVFVLGSNCKTYAQRCLVVLGEALVNPLADTTTSNTQQDSNTIFYLETTIRDSIYAVLEHPGVGVSSLSISTSILYGTVDIYVNKNTEPSTTSSSHSSSAPFSWCRVVKKDVIFKFDFSIVFTKYFTSKT